MRNKIIVIAIVFATVTSCNKELKNENENPLNGLWLVKKESLNNETSNPIKDWIRFNNDSTQSSGSGWLQHTIGSWSYQNTSKTLTITNENGSNGFIDYKGTFEVTFDKNMMLLQRKKAGQEFSITLEKTDKLPTLEANKLFGLWKFDSILIDNKEVSDSLNPSKKAMLNLRPENGYTLYNYPLGEKYGIFKAHYGRQQLEMVSYDKSLPKFQFYDFHIQGKNLVLKSKDEKLVLKLSRIDQFLE